MVHGCDTLLAGQCETVFDFVMLRDDPLQRHRWFGFCRHSISLGATTFLEDYGELRHTLYLVFYSYYGSPYRFSSLCIWQSQVKYDDVKRTGCKMLVGLTHGFCICQF